MGQTKDRWVFLKHSIPLAECPNFYAFFVIIVFVTIRSYSYVANYFCSYITMVD
jgi:hypothetical protein